MMLTRLALMAALCCCTASAVLNGKDVKRREVGHDSYGPPPRPAPQYGPPPHIPHREYGVPQQIPFREYGPPALKYGPPKLSFGGGGNSHGHASSGGGLHEQIKTYFGVPKPFYGPPHVQHQPAPQYGPPQPAPQYGPPPQFGPPPKPVYGPPPKPSYGPPPPPLKLQHRPAPSYGPPKPPGLPPQLPSPHPAPLFKPAHQPATSYGPPASGPLNLPPRPVYDAPPPNYGPPPLPIALPESQPANFNRVPETTIIVSGPGGGQHLPATGPSGGFGGPVKQVQIQIDASGHTHSVSGSQAPFHTACDGWKPIPAPVGAYVEHNHIETQGGYSQVAQGAGGGGGGFGTQYSGGAVAVASGPGGSLLDGLTDEQLVAVALQGEGGGGGDHGPQVIDNHINSIATIGVIEDSYSKPPSDSFAPGSVHAQKYSPIPPAPPLPPVGNYGPPPLPPQAYTQPHPHPPPSIQYGPPSGNPQPFPQQGAGQPSKPVAYRPPVPAGLFESIGATVQHLDQFGVKPAQQPPTYIPPATNEIPLSGPGAQAPPNTIYGVPLKQSPPPLPQPQALSQPPPQILVQQQLPQPQPAPVFVKQFGPPGPPPPPQPQYLPPRPPPQFQQQQQFHHQHHSESAYSASSLNQQFVHSQGLPLPQQARFNQYPPPPPPPQFQQQQPQQPSIVVHDCGHGPNLVGSAGYQVQQFGSVSAASAGAYNAISQSIPVAEQHTQQLLTGPADSYGPPASGNDIDGDHAGYASQKSAVAALPDGTDPNNLPGLDGLNVISAQKSQSIQLTSGDSQQPAQNFQVQFGGSLNNHPSSSGGGAEQSANHEEILSQGLLQSILTAIEQPQGHKAQSRSDSEDQTHAEDEEEQAQSSSNKVEVKVLQDADAEEVPADVKEIEPIVPEEVEEARH